MVALVHYSRPRSNKMLPQKNHIQHSYPAGRMPRDIWEEIFLHCLPLPDTPVCRHKSTTPIHLTAPLLLLKVCKAWRTVALSLPHLWSSLYVTVQSGRAFPPLDVGSDWLARTGDLPLELSLYQPNELEDNQELADEMLALFIRYLSRWRDVRLDISNPSYGRYLQPFAALRTPLLETFHLTTYWRLTRNEEFIQDLLKLLGGAPVLSSFSVSRLSDLDVTPNSTVAIPWTQLTRLDLGFIPSVSACLSIMSGCPKLESCNLVVDPEEGPLPAGRTMLPALTSLELHIRGGELSALLDCAVFPALKCFTLYVQDAYDDHWHATWPHASFLDFLTRSKCILTGLELHDTGVQSSQFIDCLQHDSVREIAELIMHDSRDWSWEPVITPRLLQLLTLPHGESDRRECLPALKALDLGEGCWLCPDGLLSDMIESRWRTTARGVARLERVHLDLHLDVHGPDETRLLKLRGEGMKFTGVEFEVDF